MVQGRSLPSLTDHGFWSVDGMDAYLVLLLRDGGDASSPLLHGVTGLRLARERAFPAWFVRGTADAIAVRSTPTWGRSQRIKQLASRVADELPKADDFLHGRSPIDLADGASCSFIQFLMRNRTGFNRLIVDGQADEPFDERLRRAYGQSLDQLVHAWWQSI
jgi:hypothetical protein